MSRQKVAFTTCVQLGRSCIEAILEQGGTFDLLITLKDDRAKSKSGRIYLDDIARKYNIPLLKIDNINDDVVLQTVREMGIDWLFVIGWSQIVKPALLEVPTQGCVGMHPTLLPMGRGRAAIPWAILKGLDKTGVSMFRMDEGVDTGDILGQMEIPLTPTTTATELYEQVDRVHVELMKQCWKDIASGTIRRHPQDHSKATIWEGRTPKDGALFSSMTMQEAERLVRAVTHPYPGAFFYRDGQKVVVWSAFVGTEAREGAFPLADGWLYPVEFEMIGEEV